MDSFLIQFNDLVIDGGEIKMVSGNEELAQCLNRELTTNQGEFFLNVDMGLNMAAFQVKGANQSRLANEIVETVLHEERIDRVQDIVIDSNTATREALIKFRAIPKTGEQIESVVTV